MNPLIPVLSPLAPCPSWRRFDEIACGSEAAAAASACAFSLSTLQVSLAREWAAFALIERRQPDVWRWAVVGPKDEVLQEGSAPGPEAARAAAAEALEAILGRR